MTENSLVSRLRARMVSVDDGSDGRGGWYSHDEPDPDCSEAATLIEQLEARVAELEGERDRALEEAAKVAADYLFSVEAGLHSNQAVVANVSQNIAAAIRSLKDQPNG